MPKYKFDDMVKINHERRAQNSSTEMVKVPVTEARAAREVARPPDLKRRPRKSGGHKHALWFVAFFAVGFFVFALSFMFAKAEISISPRIEDITLNENLSASLDGAAEDLSFSSVVISGEASKEVSATEMKEVSERAIGTAIIYNSFSGTSQSLLIDTRLEGSNGKIYKTVARTVVPGMKGSTPGSVEVKIYAAEPGEDYNSGPLDFKIFGFKGTSKYDKFYARSKGDLSGGYVGRSYIVTEEEKNAARTELRQALEDKLLKNATSQIPEGFILFKDAVTLEIAEIKEEEFLSPEDNFSVTAEGTLYGVLFEEGKLAQEVAEGTVDKYDGSEVYISNPEDLTFKLADPATSLKDLENINFNLSGPAKIVWKFDTEKLAADLREKSKSEFNQILSQYPNIDSANLSLSPIWKRSIPEDPKNIHINVNYPE